MPAPLRPPPIRLAPPLALLLLLAVAPRPAAAQGAPDSLGDAFPGNAPPMPVCNAPRDGVSACLAGRQCLCGHERGGSVTGRRDGWRWDCGALRPACDVPPADLPGRPDAAAPALFPQVTLPSEAAPQFQQPYRPSPQQQSPFRHPNR